MCGPRAVKGSATGPGWVRIFLLLGPYESAEPMLLEVSLIVEDMGFVVSPSRKTIRQTPRILEKVYTICSRELLTI